MTTSSIRLIAGVRIAIAASLTVLLACTDVTRPLAQPDGWAEQTLIGLEVRNEIAVFLNGDTHHHSPVTQQMRVGYFPDRRAHARTRANGTRSRIDVQHHRKPDGSVLSFASVRGDNGRPPKAIFVFENGRIRAVTGFGYQRHGAGWLQKTATLTVFDSAGRPLAQNNSRSTAAAISGRSVGSSIQSALADAAAMVGKALLPREAYAEEGPCTAEWLAVAAASLLVAECLTVLTGAVTACGNGVALSCGLIPEATAKLLAAMSGLVIVWDKLKDCRDKQVPQPTKPQPDGGDLEDEYPIDESDPELEAVRVTVEDFIRQAEAAGRFTCSSSGDQCLYYAQ